MHPYRANASASRDGSPSPGQARLRGDGPGTAFSHEDRCRRARPAPCPRTLHGRAADAPGVGGRGGARFGAGPGARGDRRGPPVACHAGARADHARFLLRTPEVELVAATAAAGWHGWRETDQLLRNATWLDTAFDGEGRELLARAALGLGRDSNAVVQARAAVRLAADPVARGERLVAAGSGARGHRELRQCQRRIPRSGRPAATRARLAFPPRGRHGDRLRRTARCWRARSPIRWCGASCRWPSPSPWRGPATRWARSTAYTAAGAPLSAFRLRVAVADSAQRRALGTELVAFIADRSGSGPARGGVQLLDSLRLPLTASQQLVIARSAARSGPLSRASDAYAAAFGGISRQRRRSLRLG